MKIIHFSWTPLAGAPYRIVQALRKYSNHDVFLVDKSRWDIFPQDIIFDDNPQLVVDLCKNADIIHLHNYLDDDSKLFHPISFKLLKSQGALILQQFHSHPSLIANTMRKDINEIISPKNPSLVIGQFQERYYPNSYVVPNIIPNNSPEYNPNASDRFNDIIFSPSSIDSIWSDRWNTKGALETIQILKKIKKQHQSQFKAISNQSLSDVLKEKRNAKIVIDELITGSYHLSGLEGLSLGKPVICYLDNRVDFVLRTLSNSNICPFINVSIEDLHTTLLCLLENDNEIKKIGRRSREWIEQNWSDEKMINSYINVYENLIRDPTSITRQENLNFDNELVRFNALKLPDIKYMNRMKRLDSLSSKYRFHMREKLRSIKKLSNKN